MISASILNSKIAKSVKRKLFGHTIMIENKIYDIMNKKSQINSSTKSYMISAPRPSNQTLVTCFLSSTLAPYEPKIQVMA